MKRTFLWMLAAIVLCGYACEVQAQEKEDVSQAFTFPLYASSSIL